MSDKIKRCGDCKTPVKKFKTIAKEGSSRVSECPSCGHRYSLFFMSPTSMPMLLEDLGKPKEEAGTSRQAGGRQGDGSESWGEESADREARRHDSETAVSELASGVSRDATPDPETDESASSTVASEPHEQEADSMTRETTAATTSLVVAEPDPINVAAGQRLKEARKLQGLSQQKLAQRLGITFQQIQKYERGANRMTADRMFNLSRVLQVPVSYFFQDFEQPDTDHLSLSSRELDLVTDYRVLTDAERDRVFQLVRAIRNSRAQADEAVGQGGLPEGSTPKPALSAAGD
ncbi:helix-turn-helix domain-containing protein [Rhodovibrio sodomensis]|nr:helix-turn-helix domain-containing protein [Rhodovibrio sodomensis]